MSNFSKKCFVCNKEINSKDISINMRLNLPVCSACKGTDKEKQAEKDTIEGLAEGFVCGCI